MSYSKTQAQTGSGSTLAIGATPTVIDEVRNIKWTGYQFKTDDATNMNSTAEEFITTILSPGELSFDMNRVNVDAGQSAYMTAFLAGTVSSFTLTLPKALLTSPPQTVSGDKFVFNGLPIQADLSLEPTKTDVVSCKIKISGAVTFTAGS